ncbi:MAG: hypothetical protein WD061_03195 [Candidatus Saccharimonadales bacterium]
MAKQILFFTTRPIAPPWDEASKNMAFNLAARIKGYYITLLTLKNSTDLDLPKHIQSQAIYSSTHFKWPERIRFLRLIKHRGQFSLVHYFCNSSMFKSLLVNLITKKSVKIVKTMPTFKELRLNPFLLKAVMKSDKVVVYSQYSKNKLEAAGVTNTRLIRPGIDIERFKPSDDKNTEALANLGIKSNDFVITYPGEYLRLGDMDTIIKAFIKVSNNVESAKLVLACRIRSKQEAAKKLEVIDTFNSANIGGSVVYADSVDDMSSLFNLSNVVIFPAEKMSWGKAYCSVDNY